MLINSLLSPSGGCGVSLQRLQLFRWSDQNEGSDGSDRVAKRAHIHQKVNPNLALLGECKRISHTYLLLRIFSEDKLTQLTC